MRLLHVFPSLLNLGWDTTSSGVEKRNKEGIAAMLQHAINNTMGKSVSEEKPFIYPTLFFIIIIINYYYAILFKHIQSLA